MSLSEKYMIVFMEVSQRNFKIRKDSQMKNWTMFGNSI